jgi:hypothetical protein
MAEEDLDDDDMPGVSKDAKQYMINFYAILFPVLPDISEDGKELDEPAPLSAFQAEARVRALAYYLQTTTRPSGRLAGGDADH